MHDELTGSVERLSVERGAGSSAAGAAARVANVPAAAHAARGPLASNPVPIVTRRLLLRPLTLADAPAIARYAGDWEVARMTGRIPYPYSEPVAANWIADLGPDEGVWAIEMRAGPAAEHLALVGACGYVASADGSAEIGYWIARHAWGQGFATEAARALMAYCFGTMGCKKLTCGHFLDNTASGRVIAKLGFRCTGMIAVHGEARQGEVNALLYERRRPLLAVFGKGWP